MWCHRKKFLVTERNFLSQERISCHRPQLKEFCHRKKYPNYRYFGRLLSRQLPLFRAKFLAESTGSHEVRYFIPPCLNMSLLTYYSLLINFNISLLTVTLDLSLTSLNVFLVTLSMSLLICDFWNFPFDMSFLMYCFWHITLNESFLSSHSWGVTIEWFT